MIGEPQPMISEVVTLVCVIYARARGRDELEHLNDPKRGAAVLTFGSAYAAGLAIEKSGQRLGNGDLIEVRASFRRKGAL